MKTKQNLASLTSMLTKEYTLTHIVDLQSENKLQTAIKPSHLLYVRTSSVAE